MKKSQSKSIENYFGKAKSLPIAMSMAEVTQLVSAKGVTSPPKKSWWNLNNGLIMITSILFISTAIISYSALQQKGEKHAYEPSNSIIHYAQFSDYEGGNEHSLSSVRQSQNSTSKLFSDGENNSERDSTSFTRSKMNSSEKGFTTAAPVELSIPVEPIEPDEPIAPAEVEEETTENNLGGNFEGKTKTITKEFDVNGITTLDLQHRNGDVIVETWNQDKVEVTATFKIRTQDAGHEALALNDFDINLTSQGTKAVVSSTWDELNNCACTSSSTSKPKKGWRRFLYFSSDDNSNKATLNNGEKIEYDNFKIEYAVKIPKDFNVDVSNKYADIVVAKMEGNLKVKLFRGDLTAQNVGGTVDATVKYGDATVGDYENATIELFRGALAIGSGEALDVKASYSQVELAGATSLKLEAFRTDVVSSGSVQKVEGDIKYGDLTLKGLSKSGDLDLFRSNLKGEIFESLRVNASYSSLVANKIGKLDFKKAFRTDIEVGEVDELKGELQYSPVNIQVLNQKMDIKTFRGKLEVELVEADFLSIQVDAEYTNVDLIFSPQSKYNLDATTNYTEFKGPKEIMDANQNNKNNAVSNHIVGTFNSSNQREPSTVQVKAFQGNLTLN